MSLERKFDEIFTSSPTEKVSPLELFPKDGALYCVGLGSEALRDDVRSEGELE
jgi:hypothetical protein